MEESRKIRLPLGDVSMDDNLGNYYIDIRPAIIHYESNIWGGGFDKNGVPIIAYGDKQIYVPVNIAQYGFILIAEYIENGNKESLNRLNECIKIADHIKSEYKDTIVWWHNEFNYRYKIEPPWACAMAQGEMISFYLRMFQLTKNKNYLETANKAYEFLKIEVKDKGVRRKDEYGNLWFEEYPTNQPSLVLNGFIYTVFGLYDLYRVTKRTDVKRDIDECINTLKKRLHEFDAGFWSYYDLDKKELVRFYYQINVHVPQMKILYKLTDEEIFNKYAIKWEKQVSVLNFLFVKIMYRISYRLPFFYKIISSIWKK